LWSHFYKEAARPFKLFLYHLPQTQNNLFKRLNKNGTSTYHGPVFWGIGQKREISLFSAQRLWNQIKAL